MAARPADGAAMTEEPTKDDIEIEFPAWEVWLGR